MSAGHAENEHFTYDVTSNLAADAAKTNGTEAEPAVTTTHASLVGLVMALTHLFT